MKQEPGLVPPAEERKGHWHNDPSLIKSLSKWTKLIKNLLNHYYKYCQMAVRGVAMGKKKVYPSPTQLNCLHPIKLFKSSANKSGSFIHCTKCRLRIGYAPHIKLEETDPEGAPVKTEAVEEPGSASQ